MLLRCQEPVGRERGYGTGGPLALRRSGGGSKVITFTDATAFALFPCVVKRTLAPWTCPSSPSSGLEIRLVRRRTTSQRRVPPSSVLPRRVLPTSTPSSLPPSFYSLHLSFPSLRSLSRGHKDGRLRRYRPHCFQHTRLGHSFVPLLLRPIPLLGLGLGQPDAWR